MSPWTAAALVLLLGFIPCGLVVLKGSLAERLVALQLAAVITVLILLLMAQSVARASFEDLALVLALLSFPSALLFAHYLGPASLLGTLPIALALVVANGLTQGGVKALLIAIAAILASPVVAHVTGRAAYVREEESA